MSRWIKSLVIAAAVSAGAADAKTIVDLTRIYAGTLTTGYAQTNEFTRVDGSWRPTETLSTRSLDGARFELTFNLRVVLEPFTETIGGGSARLFIGGDENRTVSAVDSGFLLSRPLDGNSRYAIYNLDVYSGFPDFERASGSISASVVASRPTVPSDDPSVFDWRFQTNEDFVPVSGTELGRELNQAFVGYSAIQPVRSDLALEHIASGRGIVERFQQIVTVTEVSAVPEPGTWATLIVGFGLVGFAARRSGRARRTAA